MKRVSISARDAALVLEAADSATTVHPDKPPLVVTGDMLTAIERLRYGTKETRKKTPAQRASHQARVSKKAAKGYETDEIRRQVLERAGGKCESCLGFWQATMFGLELDHFFGRGKAKQSAENCWALCRKCHHYKTENRPSAARWLEDFLQHCLRYGYAAEAERARARLEGICAVRKAEAGR